MHFALHFTTVKSQCFNIRAKRPFNIWFVYAMSAIAELLVAFSMLPNDEIHWYDLLQYSFYCCVILFVRSVLNFNYEIAVKCKYDSIIWWQELLSYDDSHCWTSCCWIPYHKFAKKKTSTIKSIFWFAVRSLLYIAVHFMKISRIWLSWIQDLSLLV